MTDACPAFGQLFIEPGSRMVTIGGREIKLSAREFAILRVLVEARGRPVSRTELRERLYGEREPDILGNPVQVHMHNLRAKLGEEVIETVRGSGYVIRAARLAPQAGL